jgi:hypothetical protein
MYYEPKRKVCYLLDPSILDEVKDDVTEEVVEEENNKAALFADKPEDERKQS